MLIHLNHERKESLHSRDYIEQHLMILSKKSKVGEIEFSTEKKKDRKKWNQTTLLILYGDCNITADEASLH